MKDAKGGKSVKSANGEGRDGLFFGYACNPPGSILRRPSSRKTLHTFALFAPFTPLAASSFAPHRSDYPLWLMAVWVAALGGMIGSFLNVVVYRLPAGLSVVHPGSHCPKCNHAIRWFDNVPVFSWLFLRGRCRDCRAAIAIRYPLVEAATMAMFLLLAFAELFTGGANLPAPMPWDWGRTNFGRSTPCTPSCCPRSWPPC